MKIPKYFVAITVATSFLIGSSLQAEPLTWDFKGITLAGSTHDGRQIDGKEFHLQIFLNMSLRGSTIFENEPRFDGPFRGQVVITDEGTFAVDIFFYVQTFSLNGNVYTGPVTSVFYEQSQGRVEVDFASPIWNLPNQLVSINEEAQIQRVVGSVEFSGDNGRLHVVGTLDHFIATARRVVTELPGDGRTPSGPAVVTGELSNIDFLEVFVRGGDDHIYLNVMHTGGDGSDFTNWREVPAGDPPQLTVSEPAAVFYNGALRLFVRGPDSRIYENVFTGSPREPLNGWSGWSEVLGGGKTLSGPAAVVDHNGKLRLFIRGLDNGIWENDFRNGSWSRDWQEVPPGGGLTISAPTAVAYGPTLKLFVRGIHNTIWENDFVGGTFTRWDFVGGSTLAAPSALVHQRILKLFVTGLDDGVWENDFDGSSFTGWSEVSPPGYVHPEVFALTPSAPAAVEAFPHPAMPRVPVRGYPTVLVRGEDGRILQGFF